MIQVRILTGVTAAGAAAVALPALAGCTANADDSQDVGASTADNTESVAGSGVIALHGWSRRDRRVRDPERHEAARARGDRGLQHDAAGEGRSPRDAGIQRNFVVFVRSRRTSARCSTRWAPSGARASSRAAVC